MTHQKNRIYGDRCFVFIGEFGVYVEFRLFIEVIICCVFTGKDTFPTFDNQVPVSIANLYNHEKVHTVFCAGSLCNTLCYKLQKVE